jgi:hypothetical protein
VVTDILSNVEKKREENQQVSGAATFDHLIDHVLKTEGEGESQQG